MPERDQLSDYRDPQSLQVPIDFDLGVKLHFLKDGFVFYAISRRYNVSSYWTSRCVDLVASTEPKHHLIAYSTLNLILNGCCALEAIVSDTRYPFPRAFFKVEIDSVGIGITL